MGIKLALQYALGLFEIAEGIAEEEGNDNPFEVARVALYRGQIEQLVKDPIILNCIDSRFVVQALADIGTVEDKGLVIIRR